MSISSASRKTKIILMLSIQPQHYLSILLITDRFPGLLAGSSGIRDGWVIEINGRFEAERPPASAGPPSHGRAASSVPYVWL